MKKRRKTIAENVVYTLWKYDIKKAIRKELRKND